ncbi:hypothetical protein HQ531_03690 [bacterium]|nr:hypothetical protein [bacterium]
MQPSNDSNLLSKIFVTILVLASVAGIWSIVWDIWLGHTLTNFERAMAGSVILVVVGGLIYVLIQRNKMRENETFRREKW